MSQNWRGASCSAPSFKRYITQRRLADPLRKDDPYRQEVSKNFFFVLGWMVIACVCGGVGNRGGGSVGSRCDVGGGIFLFCFRGARGAPARVGIDDVRVGGAMTGHSCC